MHLRSAWRTAAAVALVASTGCAALLSLDEVEYTGSPVDGGAEAEASRDAIADAADAATCDGEKSCHPSTLIADRLDSPAGLAVTGGFVYFSAKTADGGAVLRCPLPSCGANNPEIVATTQGAGPLAADDQNLYFVDSFAGTILRCGLGTLPCSAPVVVLGNVGPVPTVALGAGAIYFAPQTQQLLVRCSLPGDGCAVDAGNSVSGSFGRGLTVDAVRSRLYFEGFVSGVGRVIGRCDASFAGCSLSASAVLGRPGGSPTVDSITVTSSTVLWPNDSIESIEACEIAGCPDSGGLVRVANAGPARSIASDEQFVYWTSSPSTATASLGRVLKCPISGCFQPEVVYSGADEPKKLLVQGDTLYWIDPSYNAPGLGRVSSARK